MSDAPRGRVILLCGLPGAGKTTLGRRLEASGAVRMCPDEWMAALGHDLYDQDVRGRIELLQWQLTESLLGHGLTVVIEWGLWSRAERDALWRRAHALGAAIELRYLEVPVDELWRRVNSRNGDPEAITTTIPKADLIEWAAMFEAPDAEELAGYDPAR